MSRMIKSTRGIVLAACVAASAALLLSACTPPLPPDVLAAQAEANISCQTGAQNVSIPEDFAGASDAVNATLADSGFGPQLLCSIVPFRDPRGVTLALIYLYKRGSFYPFVPGEGERRDSVMELQARDLLQGELPWEMDLSRWFPVWDAPGLAP